MDFFDLFFDDWRDAGQDSRINELKDRVRKLQSETRSSEGDVGRLSAENQLLKAQLSALVRVLIAKGVITAEEYAGMIVRVGSTPDDAAGETPDVTPP